MSSDTVSTGLLIGGAVSGVLSLALLIVGMTTNSDRTKTLLFRSSFGAFVIAVESAGVAVYLILNYFKSHW